LVERRRALLRRPREDERRRPRLLDLRPRERDLLVERRRALLRRPREDERRLERLADALRLFRPDFRALRRLRLPLLSMCSSLRLSK
jgi:hypothetical protein